MSKGWNLIERFSEDIDLAIDRKFLGFGGDLSKTKISKLRKKSCRYISNELLTSIQTRLAELGADSECNAIAQTAEFSDKDPQIIEINYKSVLERNDYVKQRVLIEIGLVH